MVADSLLLGLGLAALAVGVYTDLKTREVPDWLTYSLIVAGVGIRLIHAVVFNDWMYLAYGMMGLAAFVALAFLLYYTGQWGGGDSKLLMGLGVLFATYPNVLLNWFNPVLNWPFLLIFLFNLLFVGAVYALLWTIVLVYFNWKNFRKEYAEHLRLSRKARLAAYLSALAVVVLAFFLQDTTSRVLLAAVAFFAILTTHFIIFVKAAEKASMFRYMKVSALTEGEWIAKDVYVKGKRVCGPKDLGVSKKQIAELKRLDVDKVLVKIGIPFLPSFFAAMVISLIWGNVLFYLF
jgi:Flp pilus assembly protein protease CpaA